MKLFAYRPPSRRSARLTACAFLDMVYNYLHSEAHPMYYLQVVAYSRTMIMRFVNPLDACLLYGRAYHYGCEMVTYTRANIFSNYGDFFPRVRHIHLLGFMQ
jgi:hypothetical protein